MAPDPHTRTIRLAPSIPDVGATGRMRAARMEGPSWETMMNRDFLAPKSLVTPNGTVAFVDETWRIDPRELQIFFQAEQVHWTADRTIEQWRMLLSCSRMLTARLVPEGHKGGRLVGATRIWSDRKRIV